MKEKTGKQKLMDALLLVLSEFEDTPIKDQRVNGILIEILSDRIETIVSKQ